MLKCARVNREWVAETHQFISRLKRAILIKIYWTDLFGPYWKMLFSFFFDRFNDFACGSVHKRAQKTKTKQNKTKTKNKTKKKLTNVSNTDLMLVQYWYIIKWRCLDFYTYVLNDLVSLWALINKRLIDWLIDWLIDHWLIACLMTDWLVDWLIDWLIDWLMIV